MVIVYVTRPGAPGVSSRLTNLRNTRFYAFANWKTWFSCLLADCWHRSWRVDVRAFEQGAKIAREVKTASRRGAARASGVAR